jgi:hypothetical protein
MAAMLVSEPASRAADGYLSDERQARMLDRSDGLSLAKQ